MLAHWAITADPAEESILRTGIASKWLRSSKCLCQALDDEPYLGAVLRGGLSWVLPLHLAPATNPMQPLHLVWLVVILIMSASKWVPCSAPGGSTEEGDQNGNDITTYCHIP